MKIAIRVDASFHIGSGHVMRCLVLANALRKEGHSVQFASRAQKGDMIEFVRRQGFSVCELIQPEQWQEPAHTADYKAWLQVSELDDSLSFIEQVEAVDIVVVDHYGLNKLWESQVRNHYSCRIMAIDDLARDHDCDLLLDQTYGRTGGSYQHLFVSSARLLLGCEYALLNPFFAQSRERAIERTELPVQAHRVMVSMGGVDSPNATLAVLHALSARKKLIESVTVIINPQAPHYGEVLDFVTQHSNWIKQCDFVDNMAQLMLDHTIAIGAPGTTSWERACMGLPNIIVPLADNQQTICQNLTDAGASIAVELDKIVSRLPVALDILCNNYEDYLIRNLMLCDGLGLRRVVSEIQSLVVNSDNGERNGKVTGRLATECDIKLVFDWQQMPETRKYALIPSIPTWEEHLDWMRKQLSDPSHFFYILEHEKQNVGICPVGVVRLNRQCHGQYIVSIFIDPTCHGQGLGLKALEYLDTIHPDITLNATVLKANTASQCLFARAGYMQLSDEQFQRLPIN
ncbi:UDP-2,4-diacetamido-2,4,6-trideoxy-beta-L-altropyranose hydrolase [Photobacterium sp. SDRW27]|uniref:UDP-2,4-diacetamido-2,4, 6-trideoxy-beta-L-altropyranose hydrolase n=1 Tax=Photobacterium obscurum TaxID=2829490 RepID=UPI0022439513|nr:UDP-2,4-diacetamido-2,4,6-trideoxy-beta-L-altropyranose hydrolase [Photobacterium obscurum]MCW8328229.1 UDP-2,4-diacetamido-2,4,6-trideoxy-beta-L-altropyranose hydrolase [Photobacterium obscurum]